MKKSKNQAIILTLKDKGCFHSVIFHLVQETCNRQIKHNQEMEKKYATDENFEKALMQQQYWHGAQMVIDTMNMYQDMHKGAALFMCPWDGKTKHPKCGMSKKLRTIFDQIGKMLLKETT